MEISVFVPTIGEACRLCRIAAVPHPPDSGETMSGSIPILVDQVAPQVTRGPVSSASARALDVVVEVATDVLKARLGDLARTLSDAAASAPADSVFEVSELSFTLHVGADGEVSVMSLAKGGVSAGAGIDVTLRRRPAP
jgi:hypothetical protein